MHHKFQVDKSEFLKSEGKRLNLQEKPTSGKHVTYEQSERSKTGVIQSIIDESESLKYALNSAIKKKEEMYKVLLQYKDALDSANQKIRDLESHLNEVEMVKLEVEKVRKQLIKRDEKIRSLHNRNKTLESLLEQHESEEIYLKNISYKKTAEHSKVHLSLSLEGLVQKVKSNPVFHKLFKSVCPCLNTFLDLVNQKKTEEVCLKLYKFSCELMKEIEKNCYRGTSPPLTDLLQSHQTLSSYHSAVINPSFVNSVDEEYYSKNDEERIEKLNLELKSIMAKSKEVLSNRSFSVSLKNSKIESSFSPLQTQNLQNEMKSMNKIIDITKDSLQEIIEVQPKSTKSIARRIPKVEIIGKPGNRSAKIIPKSSILKKK